MINTIIFHILMSNYSLSVFLNDFKEYKFSRTCVRITSLELFFIFISIVIYFLPNKYSEQSLIVFFCALVLMFMILYFYFEKNIYLKFRSLDIASKYFKIKDENIRKAKAFQGLFIFGLIAIQLLSIIVVNTYRYLTHHSF